MEFFSCIIKDIDDFNYKVTESALEVALDTSAEVAIISKYTTMQTILKGLMSYVESSVGCIELTVPEWNGYDDEYICSITPKGEVFIEPLLGERGYYNYFADMVYIWADNSSMSELIEANENEEAIIILVEFEK